MKVILYMAQTVNGLIARENYDEDFLSQVNWETFVKLAEEIGCFIIGRKTYDVYQNKKSKEYSFDHIRAQKIIVSRDQKQKLVPGHISANSPSAALRQALALGFTKVLLAGGGTLNSAFMKTGLIKEIIINIEPYALGRGIRIFSEETWERELQLITFKKMKCGVIQLHYKVKRGKKSH